MFPHFKILSLHSSHLRSRDITIYGMHAYWSREEDERENKCQLTHLDFQF